ncbi:MAG TPA: MFS transporter [Gaiellaceae bacterium]|nr:MFS transporter [Gaiellaceae bacterium]
MEQDNRYRWLVLAVGTAAQTSVSGVFLGIAVLAPQLRAQYHLSLGQIGILLAATSIGMTPTLLPWGLLADRVGERIVLPVGLAASAVVLAPTGFVPDYGELVGLLVAAGAFGASVNAASGRAVMQWFPKSQRGLALGIRQSNVPIGGLLAALLLPPLASRSGVGGAFLALAIAAGVGAGAGALLLRDPSGPRPVEPLRSRPLRDPAVWRLSGASGLLLVGQTATMSFSVLFLHAARHLSPGSAARVLAAQQVLGLALRVLAGHASDRRQARVALMRRLAVAIGLTLCLVAALAHSSTWVLVPVLVVTGGVGLSWNGLSFTVAAEIAGAQASGAAIGLQQTVLGIGGIVVPIGFSAIVAASSWPAAFAAAAAFPLVGWAVLRPLEQVGRY